MKDVRFSALERAIEERWPGCRVVWEPYRSPDDPSIQGWVHILHVRERDRHAVDDFAYELARRLFPGPPRFFVGAVLPEHEAHTLRRLGLPSRPKRNRRRRAPGRKLVRGRPTPAGARRRARA